MATKLVILLVLVTITSRGQVSQPPSFTFNFKFPSPKFGNYPIRQTPKPAYRPMGYQAPQRTTSWADEKYWKDPDPQFIPWQLSWRYQGQPGYTPMQQLTLSADWNSKFVYGPPAPTKLRRSQYVPER